MDIPHERPFLNGWGWVNVVSSAVWFTAFPHLLSFPDRVLRVLVWTAVIGSFLVLCGRTVLAHSVHGVVNVGINLLAISITTWGIAGCSAIVFTSNVIPDAVRAFFICLCMLLMTIHLFVERELYQARR